MLRQRGKLLEMCRVHVNESGYQYKKKRSRSKHFGTGSKGEPTSKRPKFDKDMRAERVREINEELKTLNKHLDIKQKRVDQKVAERRFDVCDMITGEMEELQDKRRKLEAELRILSKKEKKAQWYQMKKQVTPSSSDSERNVKSLCRGGMSSSDTEGECSSRQGRSLFTPPLRGRSSFSPPSVRGRSSFSPPFNTANPSPERGRSSRSPPFRSMRVRGAVMPPSVRGRSSSSPPCRSDSPSPVRGRGTGAHTARGRGTGAHTARGRSSRSPPFHSMRGRGAVTPVRGRSSSSPPCRSDSPSPVRGRGTGAHTARGRSSRSPPFRSMRCRGAVTPPSAHGQSKVTSPPVQCHHQATHTLPGTDTAPTSPPVQCHHQATHTLPGTDTAPECELFSYIGSRKTGASTSGYHSTDTLIVTDSDTDSEILHACEPQDPAIHYKSQDLGEAQDEGGWYEFQHPGGSGEAQDEGEFHHPGGSGEAQDEGEFHHPGGSGEAQDEGEFHHPGGSGEAHHDSFEYLPPSPTTSVEQHF